MLDLKLLSQSERKEYVIIINNINCSKKKASCKQATDEVMIIYELNSETKHCLELSSIALVKNHAKIG